MRTTAKLTRLNPYLDQLKRITEDLLFLDHPGRLRQTAIELHSLFSNIGISDFSEHSHDSEETWLPTGKAICPTDAGRCIFDFARTAKFLRGINDAILTAQQLFPRQPIEVLYAGCGPFAPLVVPLATRFSPDRLQFTLLDLHSRSIKSVQQIIHGLGLGAYVRDCVQADAATYVHHTGPLHIAIIETMQRGLEQEPQVANTLNLSRQLCPRGILIPEKISVDACLVDPAREFALMPPEMNETAPLVDELRTDRIRINLGRVFELSAQNAADFSGQAFFPIVTLDIPAEMDRNLKLMLMTTVNVFGSTVLLEYESAITCPARVREFSQNDFGARIGFQYSLGPKPGLKFKRMASSLPS